MSRSSGETAVVAMAVGSVLLVLCVFSIVLAVQRRRRRLNQGCRAQRRPSGAVAESRLEPTDFMKNLASWDRCHPIEEEALEKRRRAVWTLELFENHGIKDSPNDGSASSNSETQSTQNCSLLNLPESSGCTACVAKTPGICFECGSFLDILFQCRMIQEHELVKQSSVLKYKPEVYSRGAVFLAHL